MDTTNRGELSIVCKDDCGNAPKKTIIRDFLIAYAQHDLSFMLELLADDIVWQIVGHRTSQGKSGVADVLPPQKPAALYISSIISHGKTCAAHGMLTYAECRVSFCNMYTFNNAGKQGKIKEITSYLIPLQI